MTSLSAGHVWAGGWAYDEDNIPNPMFLHWDGEDWTVFSSPSVSTTGTHLTDVEAVGSEQLWAAGDAYDQNGDAVALLERSVISSANSPVVS